MSLLVETLLRGTYTGMKIVGANKNNIIVVWMCVGLG